MAINGCCLTAIAIKGNRWSFQAGSETLSKTNLGRLSPGEAVNLERALPVDGRLGGHFVQGHVDGVGQVDRIERQGEWVTMWFRVPPTLVRQMVPKGSVGGRRREPDDCANRGRLLQRRADSAHARGHDARTPQIG